MALAYFLCQAMALVCFFPEKKIHKNPELNKIVHNVTFPEWLAMLRPSKKSFSVSNNKIISSLLHVNFSTE